MISFFGPHLMAGGDGISEWMASAIVVWLHWKLRAMAV
jgi:hypothetical protein